MKDPLYSRRRLSNETRGLPIPYWSRALGRAEAAEKGAASPDCASAVLGPEGRRSAEGPRAAAEHPVFSSCRLPQITLRVTLVRTLFMPIRAPLVDTSYHLVKLKFHSDRLRQGWR